MKLQTVRTREKLSFLLLRQKVRQVLLRTPDPENIITIITITTIITVRPPVIIVLILELFQTTIVIVGSGIRTAASSVLLP